MIDPTLVGNRQKAGSVLAQSLHEFPNSCVIDPLIPEVGSEMGRLLLKLVVCTEGWNGATQAGTGPSSRRSHGTGKFSPSELRLSVHWPPKIHCHQNM